MAIYARRNLYPGINPHLNSALQQPGGHWRVFHAWHIIHIAEALNDVLPSAYEARPEKSLQIRVYDADATASTDYVSTSAVDVLVQRRMAPGAEQKAPAMQTPTLTLPLPEPHIDDDLSAVVVYQTTNQKPITRIELLSPANKHPGSHHNTYLVKRDETLRAGLHVVEIDYLHERRPTLKGIAAYALDQQDALPYHLIVFDVWPTFAEGHTDVYSFGVLDALPIIALPLVSGENLPFALGPVYQRTLAQRPLANEIDYAQEPVNFSTYSATDQQTIRQFMQHIAQQQP